MSLHGSLTAGTFPRHMPFKRRISLTIENPRFSLLGDMEASRRDCSVDRFNVSRGFGPCVAKSGIQDAIFSRYVSLSWGTYARMANVFVSRMIALAVSRNTAPTW